MAEDPTQVLHLFTFIYSLTFGQGDSYFSPALEAAEQYQTIFRKREGSLSTQVLHLTLRPFFILALNQSLTRVLISKNLEKK